MMKVIVYNEIPEIPKDVSNTCKEFIAMCLKKDPTQRCSAEELLKHPFLS